MLVAHARTIDLLVKAPPSAVLMVLKGAVRQMMKPGICATSSRVNKQSCPALVPDAGALEAVRMSVPRFAKEFVAAESVMPAGYFSDESGLSWSESPRRPAGRAPVDAAPDGARRSAAALSTA